MATLKVYNECCRVLRKINNHKIVKGKCFPCYKPNLNLLGIKELVSKVQFMNCSKSEQCRHLREDDILRRMYIELESHFYGAVDRTTGICTMRDSNRISKVGTIK